MKHLDWFKKLALSEPLRDILPLGIQPGLPMLFCQSGQMRLYIPWYCLRVWGNSITASSVSFETEYSFPDLTLLSYCNHFSSIQQLEEIHMEGITDPAIRRKALVMEQALFLLDEAANEWYLWYKISDQTLKNQQETVLKTLWHKEQEKMYHHVMKEE